MCNSGLFVMPRILYAISKDGLLCPLLSAINEKTQVRNELLLLFRVPFRCSSSKNSRIPNRPATNQCTIVKSNQ